MANDTFLDLPENTGPLSYDDVVAIQQQSGATEHIEFQNLVNRRDIGFESFPSLSGNDSGNGVYTNGFRAYVGLIPLVASDAKEFIVGRISGARSTLSDGGELRVYAENKDFNGNGLSVSDASATVRSIEGAGEARLVYFDHDGYTWIGIEYVAGGSGMSQDVRFSGRTISDSGNGNLYPKQIDFSNISNLNAYAGVGGKADHTEEVGTKTIYGELVVNGTISGTTKNFLIPHPDKSGYTLRHGSLEGPENGVYQRGTLDGSAVIDLPDYWPSLVDETTITVNLTPVGSFQKLFVKSKSADQIEVGIEGGSASDIKSDFTVYAERADAPLIVEEQK